MAISEHGRRDRRVLSVRDGPAVAALLFLTFSIHALSPVTTSTDSAWTFHLAASMLREHDIDLDEYRGLMNLEQDYRLRTVGEHVYYYYPAATPLLVAPVVIAANSAFSVTRQTDLFSYLDSHAPDDRTARLEKLVASFIVALATAGMYMIGRRLASAPVAILAACIFAFGTSMWSTASRALWQHGPSVLLLTLALYLALAAPERDSTLFLTGLILAFAYLVRPTNSLSFAFFGLYYWLNAGRRVWLYAVGALAILLPYFANNIVTYANVFPPYSYQLFERIGTPATIAEALAGTLVSPNRGLFIFSPILAFGLYGAYLAIRKGEITKANLDLYLVGILVCHWVTTSLFEDWGGAWSIGPRYFVDVLPYLVFFLIPLTASQSLRAPAWRYIMLTAVTISVFVQFHASVSIYPFMWNGKPRALVEAPERKWDWGDLQFLRGLCWSDPLEGRAPACWIDRGE